MSNDLTQPGDLLFQEIGQLSRRLTQTYSKGWGERQLHYCVLMASVFPDREILHTVCSKLSWSHLGTGLLMEDAP